MSLREMELDGKHVFSQELWGFFLTWKWKTCTFLQEFLHLRRGLGFFFFFSVIWESFYGLFDKLDTEIALEKIFELLRDKVKIFITSNFFLQIKKKTIFVRRNVFL